MSAQPQAAVSAFLERLIALLMPYFVTHATDPATARTDILETMASYGVKTRAEMINAARIIAMSFASLKLMAEATSTELTFPARLRACSLGNSLNRSCQHDESALARRLACVGAESRSKATKPIKDLPDAEATASVEATQAKLQTVSNRLSGARPATTAAGLNADPGQRPWGSPLMQALDKAMQAAPA